MIEETLINQIKCRKCGGPHFTIKCGKEKKENNIFLNNNNNNNSNNNNNNNNTELRNVYQKKNYEKRKNYRVKISELPNDINEKEMMELTYDWGNINKIKVLNYQDNTVVYIDFKYEPQADYFVKALHKTTFDHLLISVIRVDSEDYYLK